MPTIKETLVVIMGLMVLGAVIFTTSGGDWEQTTQALLNVVLWISFYCLVDFAAWLSDRRASRSGETTIVKPELTGEPGLDWTLDFTGSISELLELEQTRREAATSFNIFLLGVLIAPAALWTFSDEPTELSIQLVALAAIFCLREIYSFVIKPPWIRWAMRRTFPRTGIFTIAVRLNGFQMATSEIKIDRDWAELSVAKKSHLGIKFCWKDGTQNWLPRYICDQRPASKAQEDPSLSEAISS